MKIISEENLQVIVNNLGKISVNTVDFGKMAQLNYKKINDLVGLSEYVINMENYISVGHCIVHSLGENIIKLDYAYKVAKNKNYL